jgi:murE/murF fusion protein
MELHHSAVLAAQWLRARVAASGTLVTDSRVVQPGDVFIAWPGAAVDPRVFVKPALDAGARACLVEHEGAASFGFGDARIASFAGLKMATGPIAAEFFGHPSHAVTVLAVTGTNGKTSTSWWLAQALSALPATSDKFLARPTGLIGTLGAGRPPADLTVTGFTTPDPVLMQKTLRSFADGGLLACAIEASSIGIEEGRLNGTEIAVAVFTNFTQDHLDYHGSMEAYWQAKRRLFAWPGMRSAVINIDDLRGLALADEIAQEAADGTSTRALEVWTVSTQRPARLSARKLTYGREGVAFEVVEGDASYPVQTRLIGDFNVSNLLGVLAAMRCLGVPLADAVAACKDLTAVPGRMECVGGIDAPLVAVDYAHTPDALDQALRALRPMVQSRGGKLWCVFGCGGDRDTSKRPLMGVIAAKLADRVVVTSDNPRSEKPEAIIAQILLGLQSCSAVEVQIDRAVAIAQTIAQAQPQDVVLVAGKGHESTQEIAGVKAPFSDLAHAQLALRKRVSPVAQSTANGSMMSLATALQWLRDATLFGDGTVTIQRVHTDTRTIEPGDLFIALKGERYDANAFLAEAQARGAAAVICHAGLPDSAYPNSLPRIEVPDTRVALGELATGWRAQFDVPLIAVTGSNGKTTVTQMIAGILQAHVAAIGLEGASLATRGNLNNDIGVPLTLLRLRSAHKVAVVELGMNHPGEIAALSAMAQPTVALVNNAQREHLEFMQTVEAVALENGCVISALPANGIAVFPQDDPYAPVWASLAGDRKTLRFAASAADAIGEEVTHVRGVGRPFLTVECIRAQWLAGAWQVFARAGADEFTFALHIAGRHNVKNAMAAAACAMAAGVSLNAVVQGLAQFVPVKGRSRALAVTVKNQLRTVVDDTYNANPDSVRAAIDVLAELPGPRLLVLGDMGEVGEQGPQFHTEAGRYAQERGIERMVAMGELARHAVAVFGGSHHFDSIETLNAAVANALPHVQSVLVKGSRFMRMERVVDALLAQEQVDAS